MSVAMQRKATALNEGHSTQQVQVKLFFFTVVEVSAIF